MILFNFRKYIELNIELGFSFSFWFSISIWI